MQYDHLASDEDLIKFCDAIAPAPVLAFDTEFVSEDSYQPELCLIQVAAADRLAVIDPYTIRDLSPFWNLVVSPGRETLVHAGREEFRFCLKATGQRPSGWFDIQIAAGMIGMEYPASYGTLAYKLLGKSLSKDETRTDWRHRPLSPRQLDYALQDVLDLAALRGILRERLEKLGRLSWLQTELESWQLDIKTQEESAERWRRVGGLAGLSRRVLAAVRELWDWRDSEAQRRDMPARRVLRDDLLIELAKRQTADVKRIRALRGMERSELQRQFPQIAAAMERAINLPEDDLPSKEHKPARPQLNVLGQFLSTALGSICRSASVAPSIVGTAQDVRDLIAYRLNLGGFEDEKPPALACGWRAEVVGHVIDDVLAGRLAIRVVDPLADEPLEFERRQQ